MPQSRKSPDPLQRRARRRGGSTTPQQFTRNPRKISRRTRVMVSLLSGVTELVAVGGLLVRVTGATSHRKGMADPQIRATGRRLGGWVAFGGGFYPIVTMLAASRITIGLLDRRLRGKLMSFDLLEVPDGYRTSMVLLVAPYFNSKFIKTLVKKLSPEKIRLVIDDGVRAEDIKQLIKAASGTDVKIALGAAAGLVHIKGYYAEFVKIDAETAASGAFSMDLPTRPTRRFMVIGMPN